MTCVIGLRTGDGVIIGFDSLAAAGSRVTLRQDTKGGQLSPEIAFGYTYSYRYGQIVAHHLKLPVLNGKDEHEWTVTEFVPAMREALREHGWLKKDSEREESGQMVLAVRDRVFVIESDHGVTEPSGGYAAVGSGQDEAQATVEAFLLANIEIDDEELVKLALRTAYKLNAYVRPPWHILRTVTKSVISEQRPET